MKTIVIKSILTDKTFGGYIMADVAKYYGYTPLELVFIGHSANGAVYKLPDSRLIVDVTGTNNYNAETKECIIRFHEASKSLKNISTTCVESFNKEYQDYYSVKPLLNKLNGGF